jgi:hypothetical protein
MQIWMQMANLLLHMMEENIANRIIDILPHRP